MLLIAALSTVFSIWLLIDIYERTGIRTYEESTESLAGRPMRGVVEVWEGGPSLCLARAWARPEALQALSLIQEHGGGGVPKRLCKSAGWYFRLVQILERKDAHCWSTDGGKRLFGP